MRITSFAVLTLLASSAAFAAARPETTTYIDGNLNGVAPNTGGTLTFDDEKAMELRTGLTNVEVPYSSITKAELGAVKETSHNVPLYKVWVLHRHSAAKTETQYLIVNFKNDEGADKTMTLELAQPAAASVLSAMQAHSAQGVVTGKKTAVASAKKPDDKTKPADAWWGDDWWKTSRNSDKWNKSTGTAAADHQ